MLSIAINPDTDTYKSAVAAAILELVAITPLLISNMACNFIYGRKVVDRKIFLERDHKLLEHDVITLL